MYQADEMDIFSFHDGEKDTSADPEGIQRRFYLATRDAGYTIKEILEISSRQFDLERPDDSILEAQEILIECIHKAFKTKPYDPETKAGLSEAKASKLMMAFFEFQQKKSQSISITPTSSEGSAGPLAASVATVPPASPTMPTMGFVSTSSDPMGLQLSRRRRLSTPPSPAAPPNP